MYLLNAETEISWVIPPTSNTYAYTDFDIIETTPEGVVTYSNSPILEIDFIAPTATVEGSVSYSITPNYEGLWKVQLVIGTNLNYSVIDKVELFVFDNTQTVNPIKNTPRGTNSSIIVSDSNGQVSPAATQLTFIGSGFTVTDTVGNVTVTLDNFPVAPYQNPSDLIQALTDSIDDSQLVTSLRARVDLIDGTGPGSVNVRVAVVDDRVTTLNAQLNDVNTGLPATATAQSVTQAWVAEIDGYIQLESGSTETFITEFGQNKTSIQTQSISIDGLEGQYSVKVDANGRVAGFGLSNTGPIADGGTSEFAVLADKFTIASPDGLNTAAPFFHLTVPEIINGITIPAGTYIQSAYIADGTIQNAMIGNIIQSADDGKAWKISKDGGIEATSITIRNIVTPTTVLLSSDGTGEVFDSLADLQNQIDGNITSWFYPTVPTLDNVPASDWVAIDTTNGNTVEQDKHLGDLYYDEVTQYGYRFKVVTGTYSWVKLSDADITAALAAANAAQATADGKQSIYYSATPPTLNGEGNALTAADDGDQWLDSSNENKPYKYKYALNTAADWTNNPIPNETADWAKIFDTSGTKPAPNATANSTDAQILANTLAAATKNDVGLNLVSNLGPQAMADTGLEAGVSWTTGTAGIEMSGAGSIRTAGKSYGSGNGIFFGWDVDNYKLDLTGLSDYLRWNGSTLNIAGDIIITGGSGIGNFTDSGDLATSNRSDLLYTNGADVTSENTSSDTATVNGRLSANVDSDAANGASYADNVSSVGGMLPNWALNVVGLDGKPAGIKPLDGVADLLGVAFTDATKTAMRLRHPTDPNVGYGFPAIPIDDKQLYSVTIRQRSSSTSDIVVRQFHETSSAYLDIGKTHIGSATGDTAYIHLSTSTVNLSGTNSIGAVWQEDTYIYTPTAGTKWASLLLYNASNATLYDYDIDAVYMVLIPKTKAEVGLSSVDNTSDATQQAATLSAATSSDVDLGDVVNLTPKNQTINGLEAQTIITGGGITLSSGGSIKSNGLLDEKVDITAGVWLGYNGANYTFGVGDGNEKYVKFDGSNLMLGEEVKLKGVNAYANSHIFFHSYFESLNKFSTSGDVGYQFGILSANASTTVPATLSHVQYATFNPFSWLKNRRLKFLFDFTATSIAGTGKVRIGIGSAIVQRNGVHLEMTWNSGTSKVDVSPYIVKEGSSTVFSRDTTAPIIDSVGSNDIEIDIRFYYGSRAEFYVNGALMYTVTDSTILPTTYTTNADGTTNILDVYIPVTTGGSSGIAIGECFYMQDD